MVVCCCYLWLNLSHFINKAVRTIIPRTVWHRNLLTIHQVWRVLSYKNRILWYRILWKRNGIISDLNIRRISDRRHPEKKYCWINEKHRSRWEICVTAESNIKTCNLCVNYLPPPVYWHLLHWYGHAITWLYLILRMLFVPIDHYYNDISVTTQMKIMDLCRRNHLHCSAVF